MRKILCNNCYKRLTKKELSVYSLQWQYTGDMYCMKCRDCIDDCREDVCRKGVNMITDEQYGALKRIVSDIKKYYAELNKDFPRVMGNDVELAENFLKTQDNRNNKIENNL